MDNPQNVTELRNDLCEVYSQLRKGTIKAEDAKQISNVAGKILKSASVQLEYNKLTKRKGNDIPFLNN